MGCWLIETPSLELLAGYVAKVGDNRGDVR